jgi:hypothetical protein
MPDTYYARVSNFLSDSRDRFIAVGESSDEVLQKMNEYLVSEAAVARYGVLDPKELEQNIRTCIFQKGTKALHNRGPDSRYYHDAPPHD